jgi:hypothetical protein
VKGTARARTCGAAWTGSQRLIMPKKKMRIITRMIPPKTQPTIFQVMAEE